MYIDDLLKVFDKASGRYHELRTREVKDALKKALEAQKYDLQDEGLIEAIIKDEEDELVDSFQQTLEIQLGGNDEVSKYLSSKEGIDEAVSIFVKSLEHLMNYYYNSLIGKHFSSS